jgi:hypothetical protein
MVGNPRRTVKPDRADCSRGGPGLPKIGPGNEAYQGVKKPWNRQPGTFSTGWPTIGTALPDFPLDRVRCRFQITRLVPGYRNHFSRGSRVALPHETVEVSRDVRRGVTMQLTPPLYDLSVHQSFPVFPVFPVLDRGETHRTNASALRP